MTDPVPAPNLPDPTNSTQTVLEAARVIEESRVYFDDVCDGIGVQAEGDLAYMYTFTLTRDSEPGMIDRWFGARDSFTYAIINDEDHSRWIPKDGDIMPYDWAWGIQDAYTRLPISNVQRTLSPDAQYIKDQLEGARSDADGIANMQSEDFDAISAIGFALGNQNQQLDELITTLGDALEDVNRLTESIGNNWISRSADIYRERLHVFQNGLTQLTEATMAMGGANIVVATHVSELMASVLEIYKLRIEGLDEKASGLLGGAKNLVEMLKKPTVMGILTQVIGVVVDVLVEVATKDVEDKMEKLRNLGDMAKKLKPIEDAKTAADLVVWPTIPTDTQWRPSESWTPDA